MKRLCIYLTYDKQNIVDEYIGYMLKELKTCVDYLVVVCNETEVVQGADILEEYADAVFYRENIGFDAGGFKDALCRFVGWGKVLEYDEVVLANDSFFGPFIKMEEVFSAMDGKEADFWGLIKFGESMDGGRRIPEHIQTFFCVVRSAMLHSREFREYWERMPYCETFGAVVQRHEVKFTQYFAGLGYRYGTVADTQANDSENAANNYLQYGTICCELIRKRHFPFLKKQQFAYNMQNLQTQENLRQALDYIDKNTDYDACLIWRSLIRTLDVSDLWRNLHLKYTISGPCEGETGCMPAMAVFVKHRGMKEYLKEYLEELEGLCAIYLFSTDKDVLAEYEDMGHPQGNLSSGEGCRGLMEEAFSHEYVCIIHDADMASDAGPSCTGKSYFYSIWENLAKDRGHVQGIAARFEQDENLGLLAPPQPYFAHYFGTLGLGWDGRYEKALELSRKLNLNCVMSYGKPPFSTPEDFWIRGSILRRLLRNRQFGAACLPDLPYMWIYIAQDAGYYSGTVESADYAGMNEVNLQECLGMIAADVRRHFGNFESFDDFRSILLGRAVEDFCERYRHVYIFGAGRLARRYREIIPAAEAFIVSDGQDKAEALDGLRVSYLSEISPSPDVGVVVCVNENIQRQVVPRLEEMGFVNCLCI